jgi:hypothetical protein
MLWCPSSRDRTGVFDRSMRIMMDLTVLWPSRTGVNHRQLLHRSLELLSLRGYCHEKKATAIRPHSCACYPQLVVCELVLQTADGHTAMQVFFDAVLSLDTLSISPACSILHNLNPWQFVREVRKASPLTFIAIWSSTAAEVQTKLYAGLAIKIANKWRFLYNK